ISRQIGRIGVAYVLRSRAGSRIFMEHLFATRTVDSAPASIHAHLWEQERAKESIRRTYRRFADAWSEGDVALVASLLASDCDHVTLARAGQVRRSRADLVESWTAAFARRCPDFSVRMTASLQSIRLLGDRLALVDGDLEYS